MAEQTGEKLTLRRAPRLRMCDGYERNKHVVGCPEWLARGSLCVVRGEGRLSLACAVQLLSSDGAQ